MATILSVSYDTVLLTRRERLLESQGYIVTSAFGVRDAVQCCRGDTPFDLCILGDSIPHREKEALIAHFRTGRPAARVLALQRSGEKHVDGADSECEPHSGVLLHFVNTLISGSVGPS